MERSKPGRAKESSSEDEPRDCIPNVQVFSEQDVGRIIAVASQLQAQKGTAAKGSSTVTAGELQALATQFGIDPESLERAIALSEQGETSITLKGSLEKVRNRVLTRFADVKLRPPDNRVVPISPRLLVEGDRGIEIQWGDRRLILRLVEKAPGVTRVEWETVLGESAKRQARFVGLLLGTVLSFTIGGLLAATGSVAIVAAGVGGVVLAATAATKQMSRKIQSEFEQVCSTELKNMEVLGIDNGSD